MKKKQRKHLRKKTRTRRNKYCASVILLGLDMKWWFVILLIMFASLTLAEYIPETGCWTYPDKLICKEPNPINATVFIKNASCYSYDLYGTGSWTPPICIADAELKPTNVLVCYKFMPFVNGKPDISKYTDKYNCNTETWSGKAQLKIPFNKMPAKCNMEKTDNYTKYCEVTINKEFYISGVGNDVNGTKAISVYEIKEKTNNVMCILGAIVGIVILYALYKKIEIINS